MPGLSEKLRGYTGGNPFQESQARTYGDDKIVAEFFPTSFFWSLFNEQHEILLGTRGSGKTVLLKMLTYSCLKRFNNPKAQAYVDAKSFIGFYVPLHLEFIASLPGKEAPEAERIQYFQFAVNCAAAKSLLGQVVELLRDTIKDVGERLLAESRVVDHIAPMWCLDNDQAKRMSSLKDLEWHIDILYNTLESFSSAQLDRMGLFSKVLLTPIVNILPRLTADLGLDVQKTNWVACIDEAEFLSEPFIKCMNTFLRSDKRPLIVKMATLPFKHATKATLVDGVSIEPDGNDFNYRVIDAPWNSEDFTGLCDHLCRVRLAKCELTDLNLTLEKFLGVVGNEDDLIDYFRLELPEEASVEKILEGIRRSLSSRRKEHFDELPDDGYSRGKPYLNKFSPIYFMRRMKEENSKGARVVGWFAGAKIVRRIADGNPRRFIQIMNDMVEQARNGPLDPKDQHRVLTIFCRRAHGASEGLPRYGPVVKVLISQIGSLLADRVHGKHMVNGGCNFRIEKGLIEELVFISALKLAVDYALIKLEEDSLLHGINGESDFRLCYLYGVEFWLPMRKGDVFVLRSKHRLLDFGKTALPTTPREAEEVISQLELELSDEESV